MTMKLVGTSTKSSKYWVSKCPCDHPVPTALRLEVSKNVKYIAVTSRTSKLQVFKVWQLRDLNLGLLCEPLPEFPNFEDW